MVSESHAASVFDAVLLNGQPDPIAERSTFKRRTRGEAEDDREVLETSPLALERGRMCWSMFLEAMVSRVTP